MKHIKDHMIKAAIAKIRTYEAYLEQALKDGDEEEANRLQTLIEEWRKIVEDLLKD